MHKAYYNEYDSFAAAWLRELIKDGIIARGDVDERSIAEVKASELEGYTQCHFFAGIGVWSYALRQAGWPDDRPVWTGSCPCQPFSDAGKKQGFDDSRHLWPVWSRLISQSKPDTIFGEQVASKDGLAWLDLVHTDLESEDYAVGSVDTCAAGFGAPNIRQRFYFVAVADAISKQKFSSAEGRLHTEPGKRSTISELADTNIVVPSDGGLQRGRQLGLMSNKERRIHPTQKPVALYLWILKNYSNPGDKILDTHLGSGSSRIACHQAGLEFTGYEIDTEYFADMEERFQKYQSQQTLWEGDATRL